MLRGRGGGVGREGGREREEEGVEQWKHLAVGVLAGYDVNQAMNLTAHLSAGEHGDAREGRIRLANEP